MNRSIKTLGIVGSFFAGALALFTASDASAGPFRRLGVGYCGSDSNVIYTIEERTVECTIPSDGYLEQNNVLTANVFALGGAPAPWARACSTNPNTGFASCAGGFEQAAAGIVTLSNEELDVWNSTSWFPYIQVKLTPFSTLTGIKLTS